MRNGESKNLKRILHYVRSNSEEEVEIPPNSCLGQLI